MNKPKPPTPSIEYQPRAPFSVQMTPDASAPGGFNYRVTDGGDNRIATCYTLENAEFIARMLNYADAMRTVEYMASRKV